jgi:hypothetical protein
MYVASLVNSEPNSIPDISQNMDSLSLPSKKELTSFLAYSTDDAVAAVQEALAGQQDLDAIMDLTLSLGQELFVGKNLSKKKLKAENNIPISDGKIRESDMKEKGLFPHFNSFLLAALKPTILCQLGQQGFQLMNSASSPDSYIVVQALAGSEPVLVSVKMSVDEDLQRLDQDVDPRFGKDKKEVVEQILKAATRGEVLPVKGSLMLDFRALCLQVWLTFLVKLFITFQNFFGF